ncbi:MAG: ABC transporter permease [Myxococcales bacterium]|nr:ABC transporter permease [Myxococcales bacterium]
MIRFLALRLAGGLAVIFAVATVAFFLLRAAPGGPFDSEAKSSPAVQQALRERYHLDEPLAAQYVRYLGGLVRGELGHSLKRRQSVAELIGDHFPYSAVLGVSALLLAVLLGVSAGLLAAWRRNTWLDGGAMALALLGLSVPSFVLGPILISVVSMRLGWLPPARVDGWSSYILPALALGLVYAGVLARLARAGVLEVLEEDYIRTARAKGLSEAKVVLRHAARLGLVPVVTYLGPASAALLTGSFVVEKIFQVPGLGFYFVNSIADRDTPVLTGVFVFYVALLVLANVLADVAHVWLDPRLALGREEPR